MRKLVVVWTLCFVAMLSFSSVRAQSVQLWTQDATQPWLLEALDSFTQETGIEVELRAIGFGTEEVFTAVAAGAPPDLFTHGLAALGAFAATGFLEPFESTLDKWAFAGECVGAGARTG